MEGEINIIIEEIFDSHESYQQNARRYLLAVIKDKG